MAKIFLYLSLAVIVATAALGFLAKGRVDGVRTALKSSQESEKVARTRADKAVTDLKDTTGKLADANKTVDEQKAKISQGESDLALAKSEAEKAKADVEETKKELADARDKIGKLPVAQPKAEDEGPIVAALNVKVAELTKERDEAHQVADTLKARDKDSSERLATTEQELRRYKINGYRAGISGRVVAVNKGWNFVVVDVGDRRGAALNAPLIVTRGGQQVARLRVTSVEPGTSIADVIPGSLPRGQSVQLGDTVVFAGRQPGPNDQQPAPANSQPNAPAPQGGAATPQG
jgi:ATP/maltotriose-dependent transcriptional regulator MalT